MKKRRIHDWKIIGTASLIIILAAGSLWYFLIRPDRQKMRPDSADTEMSPYGSGNAVTATGVTGVGADTVNFAIDFLDDSSLCVEDIYLLPGDTVEAGEPYIRFTDDSINKARAELERTVQDMESAYRSRVISSGEDRIQAKYAWDTAALEAEYAPQVYQDTLTQLEMQLIRAEKDCEQAQAAYNAYYLAVENDTFYEDYQVGKLKKAYEEAYDLCTQRSRYYGVTQEELAQMSGSGDKPRAGQNDRQWILGAIALLQEEAAEAKQEYEEAKQAYQREIEGAGLKLQKLLNQSEQAQQRLADAQIERQKGSFRAKTLCELTVAKGQTAKNDYDVALISLADELERLKDARNKAVRNKEVFEEVLGDGCLYTERSGTIVDICAEKGQEIAGGDPILTYSTEELFVSAIVPKNNAEKLSAGGAASVVIQDSENYEGIITAILPETGSGVTAPVCSTVIVTLVGDVSAVGAGQTVSVVLGEDGQDDSVQCSADGYETAGRRTACPMYDLARCELYMLAEAEGTPAEKLQIAEIYVEAGQHISEGDSVCRFTQDSVESVRKALTRAQSDAHKALMKAQGDYHIDVLTAGLSHNEAMLDKALSQTVYDNTIAGLNSGRVAKLLEIETLLSEIYQLQTILTDDGYQRQRAELAQAYDRARQQMENAKERFVTSQVDAAQAFQTAREAYEVFLNQFEDSSRQITDKVEQIYAIQEEILQDQQFLERELMAAEQARSKAETEGETADARYESLVKIKEKAVQSAQDELEQAVRRLDDFNRFVGDGTIHAAGSGLVTTVGYREGDRLDDVEKLLSYVADDDSMIREDGKEDTQ